MEKLPNPILAQQNPTTLREALQQWKCPACGGTGHYGGYSKDAPEGQPCRKCNGDGLHPTARIALAASGTEAAPVTCESCKSTNTHRYENAGGLKMYSCADCGWHHFVPVQDAASPEGETKLTRLLDRLDERIAEHDQQQIPSNIRDWLEIEIAAMLRQSASPEAAPRLIATEIGPVLARLGTSTGNVAAASPEGEGREALLKLRSYNVDILAGRINYRPQDHIDVIDAALRQSAAPSGGAAAVRKILNYTAGFVSELCSHGSVNANALRTLAANDEWLNSHWQAALAQESKTGAVTETK